MSPVVFAAPSCTGAVTRKRGPLAIETYLLELLQEPRSGDALDYSPPPELQK